MKKKKDLIHNKLTWLVQAVDFFVKPLACTYFKAHILLDLKLFIIVTDSKVCKHCYILICSHRLTSGIFRSQSLITVLMDCLIESA